MVAGARRRARAYALQVLYALDVNEQANAIGAVDSYWDSFDLDLDEDAQRFAQQLVRQAVDNLEHIDGVIQGASRNWRLERMSWVDRNILRLATCELSYFADVPLKVVINEAVELAKRFGASESPSFVNGVLDRIAQQTQRD